MIEGKCLIQNKKQILAVLVFIRHATKVFMVISKKDQYLSFNFVESSVFDQKVHNHYNFTSPKVLRYMLQGLPPQKEESLGTSYL